MVAPTQIVSSRTHFNILLFAIVVGLASFLMTTDTDDEDVLPVISTVPEDSIEQITIVRTDKNSVALSRKNGRWRMTEPVQMDANPDRVQAILKILQMPGFSQLNSSDVDLAQLELKNPGVTLHLNRHIFIFGGTEPINKRRYVMFQDTIYLIEDKLYHQLRQEPLFFANRRLLRSDLLVAEIVFPNYRLYRQGDVWQSTVPGQMTMEPAELANVWQNAEALNLIDYSARESLGEVTVNMARGQTIRFLVLAKEPTLILARPDLGVEYHLSSQTAAKLFPQTSSQSDIKLEAGEETP